MVTTGAVVSGIVYVIVNESVDVLPAASLAVTLIRFSPSARLMPDAAQLSVPVAAPFPPRELDQDTWSTPSASDAVPAIFSCEVAIP